ncbi:DUF3108 domain-containing protein [Marinobacter sp.]|uniref:DUF3108 domain-containing protein n=1 Tax=Marinobacter sp. TaxID=50741 RepID=UPI003561D1B1
MTLVRTARRLTLPRALAFYLLALSATSYAETGAPVAELKPIAASYSASMDKGLAINGSARRTLEQQPDGTWKYSFNVDSFIADIQESVHFRWDDGRVVPLEYRYRLDGLMVRNRSRALNFNWATESMSGSYDGESFTVPLTGEALDPLGFQLQLRQDLKAGKKEMNYTVADEDDFEDDRFAVIGEEVQSTSFGELQTVKVEKVREDDSKRETLMWFAPELDYLLVRLVQVEPDGSRYEVKLDDADLND